MMLLQRIALERFGQLDQREYTFRPGLNLVKGPNEAGKTTLQEAILFALLGNPHHTTLERVKSVDGRISWGENRRFSITLDFTDDSGTTYRLTKDWDSQSACLTNLQTDEKENDIDSIQRAIGDMLGYGSLKLLQSTVCVEQDAIEDISAGRQEIGDQLQSIVTGGGAEEATASAVLKALEDRIAEMKRGWQTSAPKNPGPIKVKRDEITGLEDQLAKVRPQVEQVEQAKEQLITLETRVDEISAELVSRKSLRDLCDRRLEWEDKRSNGRDREKELEARIERIEKAQQIVEAGQSAEEQPKSHFPTIPVIVAGIGCLLFLVGVVISALGLLAASEPTFVAIGVLVGLPGLLVCLGGLIWLAAALSRSRSADLAAARARLDALLGEQTPEELIEKRKETSRDRRDAEEALESPEMRQAAEVTPLEYEELKQAIERLEKELDAKKQERIRCQTKCEVANYSFEDIHCLEEQRAAAKQSLAHLEEWLAIYELAYEVIEQAKGQTMRSARDELEPRISGYLSDITQGRYDSVEADDDLNLRVFSQEKGDWVTPGSNELSRGTVDQLYLAARLALLDLLYRDAKPPLLLDDPFVKFDPDRREQAMALCKEIAQEHQILFFTCHGDYDTAADWIVSL
jgi:DNA repair exonuclease SbcCD ATPase subunit